MSARLTPSKNEEGFTLIELLVVILIIGILAAIAIPAFLNQRRSAVDAALKADTSSVVLAQESYLVKNSSEFGTISKTALDATASRISSTTTIGVWVVEGKGYCIVADNPKSNNSGDSNDLTNSIWYDSALGGYAEAVNSTTPPAGGACAEPRPAAEDQAWWYSGANEWDTVVE